MKNIVLLILIALIFSCETTKKKIEFNEYQFLSNKDSLASYISKIPISKDTVFLGFRMGMTAQEFTNHIEILRKEGKTIKYDNTLDKDKFNKIFGVNYKSNGSYKFSSMLSREVKVNGEMITDRGTGEFALFPLYDEKEGLVNLIVITSFKWGKVGYSNWGWLYGQSLETYTEILPSNKDTKDLYGYLLSESIISKNRSRGALMKNNVLMIEVFDGYSYKSKKYLFRNILLNKFINEVAKEKSESIKF